MRRAHGGRIAALVLVLCSGVSAAVGCGGDEGPSELMLAQPDMMLFTTEVYPVMLRDCGFHTCHGSTERFFQVFGPGRGRLVPGTRPLDPATDQEILQTYQRARSMIDITDPARSLLVRKPLATKAGGVGHEGVDGLGRDVYQTAEEFRYRIIDAWARQMPLPTAPADPGCTTPPSCDTTGAP